MGRSKRIHIDIEKLRELVSNTPLTQKLLAQELGVSRVNLNAFFRRNAEGPELLETLNETVDRYLRDGYKVCFNLSCGKLCKIGEDIEEKGRKCKECCKRSARYHSNIVPLLPKYPSSIRKAIEEARPSTMKELRAVIDKVLIGNIEVQYEVVTSDQKEEPKRTRKQELDDILNNYERKRKKAWVQ